MFYARISRGRKLWEVAVYCFFAPVFYCLIWFCIWGGIGLRQSRQSLELQTLGEMHFNNTAHFLADGSDFCYDVPQQDVIVDSNVVFTNHLPDVTPVCVLDPDDSAGAAYRVFYSFSFPQTFGGQGLGPALSVLLLLGCALYYIACADSATLMVDSLACNGRKNSHWARRMFWACTIGSLTTALSAGGKGSVDTIYTAIVLSSIPFAILLCYLVQSTILFCRAAESLEEDADYQFPSQPEFRIPVYGGVFNALEYLTSWGKVNVSRVELGMDRATARHGVEFLKGIFLPFMSLSQILAVTYPESPMTNAVVTSCYAVCYMCWVSLFFASMALPGLTGLFRAMFVIAGCVLAFVRSGYRSKYNIRSNAIADFTTCTILWPQVLTQLNLQHMQDEKDGHRV